MLLNLTRRRPKAPECPPVIFSAACDTIGSLSALDRSSLPPEPCSEIQSAYCMSLDAEAPVADGAMDLPSKAPLFLERLRDPAGASVSELAAATGWQPHSVRGYVSRTIRRKMGLKVMLVTGSDGVKRYRLATDGAAVHVPDAVGSADRTAAATADLTA